MIINIYIHTYIHTYYILLLFCRTLLFFIKSPCAPDEIARLGSAEDGKQEQRKGLVKKNTDPQRVIGKSHMNGTNWNHIYIHITYIYIYTYYM